MRLQANTSKIFQAYFSLPEPKFQTLSYKTTKNKTTYVIKKNNWSIQGNAFATFIDKQI